MRVPQSLVDALKERAKHRGILNTRFMREIMEREISQSEQRSGSPAKPGEGIHRFALSLSGEISDGCCSHPGL
jgi:hypothetical protein